MTVFLETRISYFNLVLVMSYRLYEACSQQNRNDLAARRMNLPENCLFTTERDGHLVSSFELIFSVKSGTSEIWNSGSFTAFAAKTDP
jgi:hypothetical protein